MAQVDRTRRTPPERALIYAAVMSEASLQEVNGILDASGFRALPKSSYDLIRRSYVPVFRLYPPSLLENIQSPYTMAKGDVPDAVELEAADPVGVSVYAATTAASTRS